MDQAMLCWPHQGFPAARLVESAWVAAGAVEVAAAVAGLQAKVAAVAADTAGAGLGPGMLYKRLAAAELVGDSLARALEAAVTLCLPSPVEGCLLGNDRGMNNSRVAPVRSNAKPLAVRHSLYLAIMDVVHDTKHIIAMCPVCGSLFHFSLFRSYTAINAYNTCHVSWCGTMMSHYDRWPPVQDSGELQAESAHTESVTEAYPINDNTCSPVPQAHCSLLGNAMDLCTESHNLTNWVTPHAQTVNSCNICIS